MTEAVLYHWCSINNTRKEHWKVKGHHYLYFLQFQKVLLQTGLQHKKKAAGIILLLLLRIARWTEFPIKVKCVHHIISRVITAHILCKNFETCRNLDGHVHKVVNRDLKLTEE